MQPNAGEPSGAAAVDAQRTQRRARALLVLVAAVMLLRLATLGLYPLMDRTEARYAEIAREIVAGGDWIALRLDRDVPYWGKPPVAFWLAAASFRVLGIGEFAARLPAWLASLLTLWLLYRLALRIGGVPLAASACAILATTGLFVVLSGSFTTDPFLAASVTLSLVSFALAGDSRDRSTAKRWGLAFFAGLTLGLLSKGPVAWVLVGLSIAAWLAWTRQWSRLRALPWIPGLGLVAVAGLPWFFWADARSPGFLEYFVIGEHFERFVSGGWTGGRYGPGREQPLGTIWLYLLIGTLPWCLPAAAAAWRARGGRVSPGPVDPWLAYAVCWMLAPAVFFTPARNLLATYVLPGLPGFAFAAALCLHRVDAVWPRFGRFAATAALVPLLVLASVPVLRERSASYGEKQLVARFEALASYDDTELWYYEARPWSAEFYSRNRARLTVRAEPGNLYRQLRDGEPDYLAIPVKHLDEMPDVLMARTEEVGRFGRHVLRRELPSPRSVRSSRAARNPEPAVSSARSPAR